jgi:hypothetical protein
MTVPLRHFVVGLGFLVAGSVLGVALVAGAVPGLGSLAHVHLLLAGWVCITIMGAMTQFVPVWSGVELHSRRLATVQLGLVVVGVAGLATGFVATRTAWLVLAGAVTLAGFWTFVYNVGRTLATVDGLDVTERHFALALGFFVALTSFGVVLAFDLDAAVLSGTGVSHAGVLGAHVTIAVFGAVLTTVYGALYQLGTMFTQTELHGLDQRLQAVEVVGHPVGVVLLAVGRLLEHAATARIGGVLVVVAALAFSAVLLRKLAEMQVDRTPMHTRYAVVVVALGAWALLTLPAWAIDPLAPAHRFGAAGTVHLLVVGVIGFVVLGTLYHVVPFVVWVHSYSDRLGYEPVPMVDDLYDHRLAAVDGTLLVVGTGLLVGSDLLDTGVRVAGTGGVLVSLGVLVFTANVVLVLRRHGPHSIAEVLVGVRGRERPASHGEERTNEKRLP